VNEPATTASKPALRRQFRSLRLAQLECTQPALQRAASTLAEQLNAEQLLGIYWPLAGEADLRPLAQLAEVGHRLALPRVHAGQLGYRRWLPGDPLLSDDTGIPAPQLGPDLAASHLGLLLVPALAVDQQGIRLGYGSGWFDRLRQDQAWRAVPALAVLPAACVVQELPADPWDVPFNGWLDEAGVHWLQAV
jgi:5-formyltetrahydrofolate cyclo-ligase